MLSISEGGGLPTHEEGHSHIAFCAAGVAPYTVIVSDTRNSNRQEKWG